MGCVQEDKKGLRNVRGQFSEIGGLKKDLVEVPGLFIRNTILFDVCIKSESGSMNGLQMN